MSTTDRTPTEIAELHHTMVTRWSHMDFDGPVPLIDRREIVPGDIVASSHGIAVLVTAVHTSTHPGVTRFDGSPVLNGTVQFDMDDGHSERYGGSVPLLARDGHVFGWLAGTGGNSRADILERQSAFTPVLTAL